MHNEDKAHVIPFLTLIFVIYRKSLMFDIQSNVGFLTLPFETTYHNKAKQLDTTYLHINANARTVSAT